MSIRAIYPTNDLLNRLKLFGKFQDSFARDLFAKIQMAQDTGASMVMLSGDEYEFVVSLHVENKS